MKNIEHLYQTFTEQRLRELLSSLGCDLQNTHSKEEFIEKLSAYEVDAVLETFSTVELKETLVILGESKNGNKRALLKRLLHVCSTEYPPSIDRTSLTSEQILTLRKLLFNDDLNIVKKGCAKASSLVKSSQDYCLLFPKEWDGETHNHDIWKLARHYRYLIVWRYGQVAQYDEEVMTMTTLDLSHQELEELPSNIGHLTNLHSLILKNNALTSLPETLGNLKGLEWLDISCNDISSLPTALQSLPKLKRLSLGWNGFSVLPTVLLSYPVLSSIDFIIGLNASYCLYSSTALPIEFAKMIGKNKGNYSLNVYPQDFGGVDDVYTTAWITIVNLHGKILFSKEKDIVPAVEGLTFQGPRLHNNTSIPHTLTASQWSILREDLLLLDNLTSVSFEHGALYEFTVEQLHEMFEVLSTLPSSIEVYISWKSMFVDHDNLRSMYQKSLKPIVDTGYKNLHFHHG